MRAIQRQSQRIQMWRGLTIVRDMGATTRSSDTAASAVELSRGGFGADDINSGIISAAWAGSSFRADEMAAAAQHRLPGIPGRDTPDGSSKRSGRTCCRRPGGHQDIRRLKAYGYTATDSPRDQRGRGRPA